MPFLGFGNYNKPGPGVSKEVEERSAFSRFFLVYKRRFSKFMQLNLVFMIPVFGVLALMIGLYFAPIGRYVMELKLTDTILQLKLWEMYVVPFPLVIISPFFAGVMVVARRLANEEYAFIWSEYWKGVKENWKPFLVNGIFLYVMYVLLSFAYLYYNGNLSAGALAFIPYAMIMFLTIILVFSQYYVSLMIVSVHLKLTQIYRNAFIFAIMGLGRNILITLILAIIVFVYLFIAPIMPLLIIIGFLVFVCLLFSFIAYANSFIAYPMIKNYILAPYNKKEEIKNDPAVQQSSENFEYVRDELDSTSEENSDQYVYVNGMLMKRSSLDDGDDEQIFQDKS